MAAFLIFGVPVAAETIAAGSAAIGAAIGAWWYQDELAAGADQLISNAQQNIADMTSDADDKAAKKAEAAPVAQSTTCSGKCPPPPECRDAVEGMKHKNRKLNKELKKYNASEDAKGGFEYRTPDGALKKTVPGGHYKEIRDLQRGLKNELHKYNRNKCSENPGPDDRATREAAQKNVSKSIERPPGFPLIHL